MKKAGLMLKAHLVRDILSTTVQHMLNWLKWRIAKREMEELERWRIHWIQHRQWFAEFKDASAILDNLQQEAIGGDLQPISDLRECLRKMRCLEPQNGQA